MKRLSLPVAVFVAILGCFLAVMANVTTTKCQHKLDAERYKRIAVEQQLQSAENTLAKFKTELKESRDKIAGIQSILSGQEMSNSSLQENLSAAQQENLKLQKQLKTLEEQVAASQAQISE